MDIFFEDRRWITSLKYRFPHISFKIYDIKTWFLPKGYEPEDENLSFFLLYDIVYTKYITENARNYMPRLGYIPRVLDNINMYSHLRPVSSQQKSPEISQVICISNWSCLTKRVFKAKQLKISNWTVFQNY